MSRGRAPAARCGRLAGVNSATELVQRTEQRRQSVSRALDGKHRRRFGQYFTPAPVANFLASLLSIPTEGSCRLLDPGAGVGSLAAAVVAEAIQQRSAAHIQITAFELDEQLVPHLAETLRDCQETGLDANIKVDISLRHADFIDWASSSLAGSLLVDAETFTACVMNPPYRKINTNGADRLALERIGVQVTNLYTAFLALGAALLDPGGQLSAIVPRSFANGPYFKPFRQFFLARMALDRLHVYEKRGLVFADTEVLQENVVFKATRDRSSDTVVLSTSAGFDDVPSARGVRYASVVHPDDPHQFVHIPVSESDAYVATQMTGLPATLRDLKVQVSTGRVVDFRSREHLRQEPAEDAVPLIYPGHLQDARILWPLADSKKPNALANCNETVALLLPNETYAVVKRFSAKEEVKRVVAALSSPEEIPGPSVAFENHLNVFHRSGHGLPRRLALGLVAFLNSSAVDTYIRQFSGHTQINATDLRGLRYPSVTQLEMLGRSLTGRPWPSQLELDELIATHVPALNVQQFAVPAAA
ncbi:MAG: Eco57I restriction-modification methylase domain-containing protein [Solirubrobacteraceae bacterium]